MVTLTVGTNSYSTRAEADTYLDASARASSWKANSPSNRDRFLISAFREIEKQRYLGVRTGGDAQSTQFPRDGIENCDGIGRSGDTPAPIEVQEAQIELAFEISQDPELEGKASTGSNVKSVGAGSAKVSFFQPGRDASGRQGTRFPTIVQELLRCFLSGGALSGAESSGTDECSQFTDDQQFNLSDGLK